MTKAETAYRTIAEVSDLLQVQPSVLRFWETQFRQIKPLKRMGRRYYTAEDVVLLARIRDLLYQDGFTIKGVQKKLKEKQETEIQPDLLSVSPVPNRIAVNELVQELISIRDSLKPYID
ncbi:MAG: MerR family transcriptional regulator [Alphaproteobacteria bacterium]|nr:MerR family transcriptional regulator [Alphaproteobacteria bacterium]